MYTTLISPATLEQLLVDTNSSRVDSATAAPRSLVIVDCRFSLADTEAGSRAYRESHIPGAYYAHLDHDLSDPVVPGRSGRHPLPNRETLAQRFRDWGVSEASQLVCYDDRTGAIASRLWWLANWLGHPYCAVLDGGMAAWIRAGGVLSAELPAPARGNFRAGKARVDTVPIEQLSHAQLLLLDAREAARYRGESEPIDPVAGHIPGALNHPFTRNLDEHGAFRTPGELTALFEPLLAEAGDRRMAHYCGSGVTATHNILAMQHAGLSPGTLYAGSFSEWITRDRSACPVATGEE